MTPFPPRKTGANMIALRKIAAVVIIAIGAIAIPMTAMFAWLSSRPSWQLSARNSTQGVVVEVFRSNAAKPTYTVVLSGQEIDTDVERVTRMELPVAVGKTRFFDETIRPGRWIVVLNKSEIDIMETVMIVDGVTQIAPQVCAD